MKRMALTAAFLVASVGGGFVIAQTAPPKAQPTTAAAHEHGGPAKMGEVSTMCGGMMGGGMMGHMMMGGANTKVTVKNVDKGVTITLTSTDSANVARLQKMAEAMRLMHEAMTP